MAIPEGPEPGREPKRARRGQRPPTPINASPEDRLDALIRERIDALEVDKRRLLTEIRRLRSTEIKRLQSRVDQLIPENARLHEALSNAETNNVLATVLISVGGFGVSYATFTGKAAAKWANVAAGCLIAGIIVMLAQSARRWLSR